MIIRKIERKKEKLKRKVAAYARVSTTSENQEESFESQVAYFTKFIQSVKEWEMVKIYSDDGVSGLSAEKRPGFMEMVADAKEGKLNLLLVKSISRFARNSLEAQSYMHLLKSYGVEIRFERENISSFDPQAEMVFNFLVVVAQEESKSISQNRRWSYEKLAEQGIRHIGNNHVLGYDEICGVLTPNEDAWAVKLIFEQYAEGKSLGSIADDLAEKGFVSMRGKERLTRKTLACILRNEIYKGDRLLQKTPHNDFMTHRPVKDSEYKSYYVPNDHEGIVSSELWEKVQTILNTPKDHSTFPNKNSHPLRGKLVCGECGEKFYRMTRGRGEKRYGVWGCNSKKQKGAKACGNGYIREDIVERAVTEMTGIPNVEKAVEMVEFIRVFNDRSIVIELFE